MIPLFLFSLPRSGSTLVQRILATHPEITTVPEPWILLPYLYTLKEQGTYSEYGHHLLVQAIDKFCRELPNGKNDYVAEIRSLTLRLYSKAAKNPTKYFLDKTPRYALVADEIINLFPEAKFVFLWRNPLAIAASMITTWANGKWNLYRYRLDLFDGLANLIAAYEQHTSKVYVIKYESLLLQPEIELQGLCNYLDIAFDSQLLSSFTNTQLRNDIGDPTGVNKYTNISQEPLEKWKSILANPLRKAWCRNYLRWIDRDRLAIMGYAQDELLDELNAIPFSLNAIVFDTYRLLRREVKKPWIASEIYNSVVIKD